MDSAHEGEDAVGDLLLTRLVKMIGSVDLHDTRHGRYYTKDQT